MIQIFSKEFKNAVKNAVENVKTTAEKAISPETSAKIVKMYNQAKDAATDAIEQAKDVIDTAVATHISKEDIATRTKYKKDIREAQRRKAKEEHDATNRKIQAIASQSNVEEVYCQRSQFNPTFKEDKNEPIITEVAKVTVIGVVRRLTDGRFRLQVSFSRRNINDRYVKNLGYLVALERAFDPVASFEIEGHNFETIKVGDFESPLLKDIFLAIADELIAKYEYAQDVYTKPMRNAIEKNVQDLVDFVKDQTK
jgi:hypothetical protein